MGVFIFFSISAVIIVLGLGMTFLTLRHHWKLSRLHQATVQSSVQSTVQPADTGSEPSN